MLIMKAMLNGNYISHFGLQFDQDDLYIRWFSCPPFEFELSPVFFAMIFCSFLCLKFIFKLLSRICKR